MKVSHFFTFLCMFLTMTLSAQDIAENAVGLRLGDSDGFGAEISYQRQLQRYRRLELDLGFRSHRAYDAFKLAGVYQWVRNIDGGFNWYFGVGGGLGNVDFELTEEERDGGLFVFAAGDLGIEYNFDFPLLLSLDMRPEIGLLGYSDFSDNFDFDIALGLRYQF